MSHLYYLVYCVESCLYHKQPPRVQTMDGAVLQTCHIKVSQQLILFVVLINYFIISTTAILVVGVLDNVSQTFSFF